MSTPKDFVATLDSDARKTPRRIAFITKRTSPQVQVKDEERVMTYPEVFFRVAVAIEVLAIVLVVIALIWNAPLESLADLLEEPPGGQGPFLYIGPHPDRHRTELEERRWERHSRSPAPLEERVPTNLE